MQLPQRFPGDTAFAREWLSAAATARSRAVCCPTGLTTVGVTDLTFVAIPVGFVYVGVVLDAWSRHVVGYAISRRIDTPLTLAACRPPLKHGSHHPDVLITPIAVTSMPPLYIVTPWPTLVYAVRLAAANPSINAKAVSFMKTIKSEHVYLNEYRTFARGR